MVMSICCSFRKLEFSSHAGKLTSAYNSSSGRSDTFFWGQADMHVHVHPHTLPIHTHTHTRSHLSAPSSASFHDMNKLIHHSASIMTSCLISNPKQQSHKLGLKHLKTWTMPGHQGLLLACDNFSDFVGGGLENFVEC